MSRPRTLHALLLASALVGCAGGEDRVCNADADCASGVCRADGTCDPPAGDDAGPATDAFVEPGRDAASGDDAGRATDGGGSDAGGLGCTPNHDGRVDRTEVPLAPGLHATFRVATGAAFDTSGEIRGDGSRRWDLSGSFAGDHDVLVQTRAIDGMWFAGDFPGAAYSTELSASSDLLGVFDLTASDLSLRGVASPDDGAARTRLTHDPPVRTLAFPLREGDSWTTTSTVSGVNSGFPATWTERYESSVDAHGELVTPFGTFDVLRVRIVLTRTVGLVVTVVRSFAFVTECFGTVATITSRDDETRTEFTQAAELRRIAP